MTNPMRSLFQSPLAALAAAFVLALVHLYLFYGNTLGVSYPLFVVLFYSYMYFYTRERVRANSWFSWFLFAVILLLSMTYVMFDNWFMNALNALAVPVLIFLHMAFVLGEKKRNWSEIGLIGDMLNHLIPQSFRHFATAIGLLKPAVFRNTDQRHKQVIGKVLMGLVIAVPLLFIVIMLLASADGVFDRLLSGIPTWLSRLSFGGSLTRGIWVVFFSMYFFGYLWGFVNPKKSGRKPELGPAGGSEDRAWAFGPQMQPSMGTHVDSAPESELVPLRVDPITIATVLAAINIVYILFVLVQFTYLFGAGEGVLPQDLSYAEYARSGFGELMMVTSINFIIMIVSLLFTREGAGMLNRANAYMLYLLVACSGVMVYSAYTRLALYEEAYGYTYIRYLVHAFMIFLSLLLIIAAVRISMKQLPLAKIYIVVSLVAYVLVNYIGMDHLIAAKNIERYRETGAIDAVYLSSLSADAVPLLIELSEKEYPLLNTGLHERWKSLVNERKSRNWPAFNWSQYRAERALEDFLRK